MKLIRGSKFDLPFIVSRFPEIMGGIDTTKINLEGREFYICEDSCRETPEGFIICILYLITLLIYYLLFIYNNIWIISFVFIPKHDLYSLYFIIY